MKTPQMAVLPFHTKLSSASKLNFSPDLTSLPGIPIGSGENDSHSLFWVSGSFRLM